jgi:hypothetical protein
VAAAAGVKGGKIRHPKNRKVAILRGRPLATAPCTNILYSKLQRHRCHSKKVFEKRFTAILYQIIEITFDVLLYRKRHGGKKLCYWMQRAVETYTPRRQFKQTFPHSARRPPSILKENFC